MAAYRRKGAFVNLANREMADAYVAEIPPRGQTNPEQHMFEEMIFILSGRGRHLSSFWTAQSTIFSGVKEAYSRFTSFTIATGQGQRGSWPLLMLL